MNNNAHSDITTPHFDIINGREYKKYIPVSEMDRKWGFVIHDIGRAAIPPDTEYPPKGHPGTHRFSWDTGRVLNEYNMVFITEGKGIFESRSAGIKNISAGDGIVLFPGEWHRYKPLQKTGWTENWVGFSGEMADSVMKDIFFNPAQPLIHKCVNMLVENLLKSLFRLISEEEFGYQRTAAGVCLQLIAEIYNIQQGSESKSEANTLISKAKYLMHKKIDESIDFQLFCKNHYISYSKFRTDFRHQTGFAPLQYFLLIKLEKAKDLLNNTDMMTKQIAFRLGFKSDHYFSRIFKMKTGYSPQEFRGINRGRVTNKEER